MSRAVRPCSVAAASDASFALWTKQMAVCRPVCIRVARGLLRDDHMAEDVVQEAFSAVWWTRDRFDPARSSHRSWLLMMTHHRAVDRIRAEQRHRDERLALTELELRNDASRLWAADPCDLLVRDETGGAVRAALLEIPILQRETLMLSYWGGYSQREIAQLMQCPLGTVKTRCLSGIRRLRVAIEGARAMERTAA